MRAPPIDPERFRLGLGTGHLRDDDACEATVRAAIKAGYRHLDTASQYGNERAIGRAIATADVDREDLFVATKVHSEDLAPADVRASIRRSLSRLGLNRLDLVYVHWPAHAYDPETTLPALERAHDRGAVRHLGLSNFTLDQVETARSVMDVPVFAIQAECHPYLRQDTLRAYTERHGIWLVAHTPLCQGHVVDDETIQAVADHNGVTAAQASLAWLLGHEHVAAVPGARREYLRPNREALSIDLSSEDIAAIERIDTERRFVEYEFAPWTE